MPEYHYGVYADIGDSIITGGEDVTTVPVYFGTAPVNLVRGYADKQLVNTPIRIYNLNDAINKIGWCDDWGSFTLCEAIDSHFNSPNGSIGPVYLINVLDPDLHVSDMPKTESIPVVRNKAQIRGTHMILDSVKIARPVPEGTVQSVSFRGKGKGADDNGFDYAKAYEKAGIQLTDSTLTYEPTGEIDPKLIHDGKLYVGLTFSKPEGATRVTVKCNGKIVDDDLDLSGDGDFVLDGQLVEYVAVADADGTPLDDRALVFQCEWTGGDTSETVCMVSTGDGAYYEEGRDYALGYNADRGAAVIEDLTESMPASVQVTYSEVDDTQVTVEEIVGEKTPSGIYTGIYAINLVFSMYNAIPNILAAPGWSHIPEVYKTLCKCARKINGHWDAMVFADMPIVDEDMEPVDTIEKAIKYKDDNRFDDERSKVFWPMVIDDNGRICHISALATAEQMRVDDSHNGIPFETCGNKSVPVMRQYFGEESLNRGFDQTDANELTAYGITTVAPWGTDYRIWGDSTAAYIYGGDDYDARAIFDVTLRMLMHITNSFQQEWADEIDEPMTRAMKDRIINREQEKLDGYVATGALLGTPTVVFSPEVTSDDVLHGRFIWDIRATVTPALKSAEATVVYTDEGFSTLLDSEE